MTIAAFAFYLFAGILLTAGTMVILSKNPVHSVLWLIVAFFNAAGLFVILGAEFLAMLLVIVYVGAVAVLFLFVVMMLDIDFARLRAGFVRYLPLGLIFAVVILSELVATVGAWQPGTGVTLFTLPGAPPAGMTNTQWIGSVLYTRYLFVFQAAGMILLTSMVGAIVLTHRQRIGIRKQDIGAQVARTPASAIHTARPAIGAGVEL